MQRFPCPFCGLRDEREFHYAGELGKTRPATFTKVSDKEWRDYLYAYHNEKGAAEEVWVHLTCREMFVMCRDTVTMEVIETRALRKEVSS